MVELCVFHMKPDIKIYGFKTLPWKRLLLIEMIYFQMTFTFVYFNSRADEPIFSLSVFAEKKVKCSATLCGVMNGALIDCMQWL